MSSLTIIKVFLFSIFLIICFSLETYCQNKKVNLIWIDVFEDRTLKASDTLLSVDAHKVLASQLENECLELCVKKNLEINYATTNDSIVYKKENGQAPVVYYKIQDIISEKGLALCIVNTTYTKFDDYYNITSYIYKYGDGKLKETKIPNFRLQETTDLLINKKYNLLNAHAESIASELYRLNGLKFTKLIYPTPGNYPGSLSSYNSTSHNILHQILKISNGKKIAEGMSEDADGTIEANLQFLPHSEVIIQVSLIFKENPIDYAFYSSSRFNIDTTTTYQKSINHIAEDLANQIKESRY